MRSQEPYKIYFLTYGDSEYRVSKKRIIREAKAFKRFSYCYAFGREDLDETFIQKTSPYINKKQGGGYWLWKPYIVDKVMSQMNEGDFLVYADAGCTLNKNNIKRFDEYIEICKKDLVNVLLFDLEHLEYLEYKWTKQEVFTYFGIKQGSIIASTGQLVATAFILRKTQVSELLIKEWLSVAINRPDLFSDEIKEEQHHEFMSHRHDQSVFSVLRKIKGTIPMIDETYGEISNIAPIAATRIKQTTLADDVRSWGIKVPPLRTMIRQLKKDMFG